MAWAESISSIDDTERHGNDCQSLNGYTDPVSSTYDIPDDVASRVSPILQPDDPLATLWSAFDSSSAMPDSHGGLRPWPDTYIKHRDDTSRLPREHSSGATLRAHYDPARQPLDVSQQTAASSVRDMALRKRTSTTSRNENVSSMQPLKSALKRYPSQHRPEPAHPQLLYPPDQAQPIYHTKQSSRLSRLGSLFAKRSSVNKPVFPRPISKTPSTASAASLNYAASGDLRRKRSIGWDQPLRQYDNPSTPSMQSNVSDAVRQAKLADDDVYEKAKINIKRPPRGITNWFDGVEISSDEEELTPVELPAYEALPSTFTTFSAEDKAEREEQRSKGTEQPRSLAKAERMLGQPSGIAHHNPEEHVLARARKADNYDYRTATPKPSEQTRRGAGHKQEPATSTISSLDTSVSENEHASTSGHYSSPSDMMFNRAATVHFQRPHIPPRKLQNIQIAAHNAYHINEHVSTPHSSLKYSHRSPRADDNHDYLPSSSHKGSSQRTMSDKSKSHRRPSTRLSSSVGYDESNNGGVSLDSSLPDISHMMAVTEEEMALLEMMRNKRAAMQKDSFSEGYRQALQREHDQLMQRRLLAQQTALRMMRSQQAHDDARHPDDTDEHEVEPNRVSKLRQQEMDRSKRLEKFLAMDTSLAAALDDAGVTQDRFVQDWPLTKQDNIPARTAEKRRHTHARTPSLGQQHVYHDSIDEDRHDPRSTFDADDIDLAVAFPGLPNTRNAHYKKAFGRESIPSVRFESEGQSKLRHRSQQMYHSHMLGDSEMRQELYTMNSDRSSRPRPSRQQVQSTTFLRSISDFHAGEDNDITSQGSASISASVVSPVTPSSTGAGHAGKVSSYSGVDSEDNDFFHGSSEELSFSRPMSRTVAMRKQKQLPSALAILAGQDQSRHRHSMASNNTAGDDVLAAWAELGGNEGMLPTRSFRTRAH